MEPQAESYKTGIVNDSIMRILFIATNQINKPKLLKIKVKIEKN